MIHSQRLLARHALGFPNKKNTSYRNHYCCGAGTANYAEWEGMVAQGFAIKRTGPNWGGDDMVPSNIERGIAGARNKRAFEPG